MTPNPTPALAPDQRRQLFYFLLLATVVLAAGIGLRDPWPSDEPRFTLVARQMVESGDWLFPHRGTELYSDKPPLLMWLEAACFVVTGNWRIAFLLPSLFAALLTIACTYDLGRRLWTHRAGLIAAAAMLINVQFVYQMKRAQIDPLVTGWITLANWGLLLHFLRGPDWRKYWLGCFAAGLGVISKGVGVLALLLFLPYLVARWQKWEGVTVTRASLGKWLLGGAAFLAAIAIWLVPMLIAAKTRANPEYDAYVNDLLFRQTAKRYSDSWAHVQPAWYFASVMLFNWLPFSLLYLGALPAWWAAFKAREARVVLPLVWVAIIVVFFSIPAGKRDVYVMPALPMIVLAMAPALEAMLEAAWVRTLGFGFAVAAGLGLTGYAGWALAKQPASVLELIARKVTEEDPQPVLQMGLAMGIVCLAAAVWFRWRRGGQALWFAMAGMFVIYGVVGYPLANDGSSSLRVMRRAGEIVGSDGEIGLVAWKEQNMLMADRKVADFGFKKPWNEQFVAARTWQAEKPASRWIFLNEKAITACVDREKAVLAGASNRRKWYLLPSAAVKPDCNPGADDDAAEANEAADP